MVKLLTYQQTFGGLEMSLFGNQRRGESSFSDKAEIPGGVFTALNNTTLRERIPGWLPENILPDNQRGRISSCQLQIHGNLQTFEARKIPRVFYDFRVRTGSL